MRSIFADAAGPELPATSPEALADAIVACAEAGARVLNLSVATAAPSSRAERQLTAALDRVAAAGAIVVAAAGNQHAVGSSAITRHPGVLPVIAYGRDGRPMRQSNLGGSIGRRGLGAPGDEIVSLDPRGLPGRGGGTSAAAAFVTGTIALLWSLFPDAGVGDIRAALAATPPRRRRSIVPPLLDATAAYQVLARPMAPWKQALSRRP